MRNLTILSVALLASCGGGTDNLPDAQYATSGACATAFYRELIGSYSGQLERDDGSFYTSLEITGEDYYGTCNMEYQMLTVTSQPDIYSDIDGLGDFLTMLDIDGNQSFWDNPQFPVDAYGQPYASIPDGDLTVIGGMYGNGVAVFGLVVQGEGVLTIKDTFGELIKQ